MWEYLAGFLDGEGCIRFDKATGRGSTPRGLSRPRIRVGQKTCHSFVLDVLFIFLEEHGVRANIYQQTANDYRVLGVSRIDDIYYVLHRIRNLVIVKKDDVENMIAWFDEHYPGLPQRRTNRAKEILAEATSTQTWR